MRDKPKSDGKKKGWHGYVTVSSADGSEDVYRESETPMCSSDAALLTADNMPSTWPRMWNSTAAKTKMYRILADLLKDLIVSGKKAPPKKQKVNPATQYIIHDMDGGIWTDLQVPGGAHVGMPPIQYGEGDLKALRWSLYHARRGEKTLLVTIDWDSSFTLLPFDAPIDILIGRVFVSKAEAESLPFQYNATRVELVKRSATKSFSGQIHPAFEILHIQNMIRGIGRRRGIESFDMRLVYSMAMLSFNGCDYCGGLNRFGFTESVMLDILGMSLRCPPWIETRFRRSDPYRKILRFYPERYLFFLRHGSPKYKKVMPPVSEFNREVLDMIWILMYSLQFDAQRVPGGPREPDYDGISLFSDEADTVETLISDSTLEHLSPSGTDYFDFVEEFPTYNPEFSFGYPPRQRALLFPDE